MKVQATANQSKEMKKKSSPLTMEVVFNGRSTSQSMSVSCRRPISLGRAARKLILFIIRRAAGSIIGNAMLLHTTLVAIEKHVIYLFLIVYFQILLLSAKPYPKIL